jgi:hypothetical protein
MGTSRQPDTRHHLHIIRTEAPEPHPSPRQRPARGWLWFGVVGGPVAWGIDYLLTSYTAVHACQSTGTGVLVMGLSAARIAALCAGIGTGLAALAAGLLMGQIWWQTRTPAEETTVPAMRWTPFWALGGLFLSMVSLIAIIVTTAAALVVSGNCPV